MKKVLITGGAGFIGANFTQRFLDLGHSVHLIDQPEANLWRLEKIKDKINTHFIDLKDYEKLESFIFELKPDIIIHLAAYGTYPGNQKDIKKTIETNILGTINLVNACSKINFDCLINTGSSSEYGIKDKPMQENDLLEPDNLYGVAKAAATMYCQHMAKKLDLPIAVIRPFSVYGYFEEKERLVPTVIKACLENSQLNLSSSNSVRDYIFIEDLIDGYLTVIENIQNNKGEIFNLGIGEQKKISEVVEIVKKITQSPVEPQYGQVKAAQAEPKNWIADISKMKSLGWQPEHNLDQGLEKTIAWFKQNLSLYK